MRNSLSAIILATTALAATPAAAQDRKLPPPKAIADALGNPAVQEGIAGALSQLATIVLDTRVGPMARAVDPRSNAREDTTLGDLARRNDPAFDEHLRDGARKGVARAGVMANGAVAQTEELKRTLARLRAVLGPVLASTGTHAPSEDN